MNSDNQSAISIALHDGYHARSKHIDIRYHFVRERIKMKQISVHYVSTHDMFTKAMGLRSWENEGIRNADGA
ncbi:unnamed protein product [Arctia plantaginis]|uniref:Polyprotein n=1 Tax=Arctia plantaginis TaxID=874455 RepID=A0A8S1B0U0_ARCPL|nr:unnamed protein product [Arctia plantaginis]